MGFSEHTADSIFNRRHCKDVFICLFLVIMKIPRQTGVQGLRGIHVAVVQTEEGTPDHPVVIDQRPANRTNAPVPGMRLFGPWWPA